MSARKARDEIAAALYLRAVLPAFEELHHVSPHAKALVADWNCSVEFAAPGHSSAAISFNQGTVSILSGEDLKASISLFFLSSRQLVNQFEGKRLSMPVPRRGIHRVACLYRFIRLGKILEQELEQHPRLLMSVALGSLKPLVELDHQARHLMSQCPPGLAEFGVPSSGLFGWVEWLGDSAKWGRGRAPRTPDVSVSFANEQIALAALRNELDELAAIGAGALIVRGRVPLADTLGAALARADAYLERGSLRA